MFSFYLSSPTKSENRRAGLVHRGEGYQWEGGGIEERGYKGEYSAKKVCSHVRKCKNDTC
jgi:hypothetical protein